MRTAPVALLTLCFSAFLGTGCSKEGASPVAATRAPSAATATLAKATSVAPDSKKRVSACDMVTQAEMSAILGGAVVAAAGGNDRPPASTECIYSSAAGPSPNGASLQENEMLEHYPAGRAAGPSPYGASLQVDWGGGDQQALGVAAGLAKGAAPAGAVDPLQGLGERAYLVTADQVFISTQGNLMMIRFLRRTGDVIPKARRIYETAKARM